MFLIYICTILRRENDRIKKKTNNDNNMNIPSTKSIYIYIQVYS